MPRPKSSNYTRTMLEARQKLASEVEEKRRLAANKTVEICTSNLLADVEKAKSDSDVRQQLEKRQRLEKESNELEERKENAEASVRTASFGIGSPLVRDFARQLKVNFDEQLEEKRGEMAHIDNQLEMKSDELWAERNKEFQDAITNMKLNKPNGTPVQVREKWEDQQKINHFITE